MMSDAEAGNTQAQETFTVVLDDLEEHPGHRGIPNMRDDNFPYLVDSVDEHGVMDPVEILSPEEAERRDEPENAGTLVDGRQRCAAAREVGLEEIPAVHAEIPNSMSTREYILRKATDRRNLTTGQRALLGSKLKKTLQKEARDRQGSRTDLQENLPGCSGSSRDQAGDLVGVSGRSVDKAEKLQEEAPDLAQEVETGEKSLHAAKKEADERAGRPPGTTREEAETKPPAPVQGGRRASEGG